MMSILGQPFSKNCDSSLFARITKNWSFHLKQGLFWYFKSYLILKPFLILLIAFWLVVFSSNQTFSQTIDVPVTISNQDVLDTISAFKTNNPSKSVTEFKARMPPVADEKTQNAVLNDLPKKVLELQIKDEKLEEKIKLILKPLLSLYGRENAYKLIIFKNNVPFAAIDTGTVIFLSTGFLMEIESDDELLGTVAHEVGHEYFIEYSIYTKHLLKLVKANGKEIALSKKFGNVLAIIELQCDAFSSITLTSLGFDPTAFIDGLDQMTKKYKADEHTFHPSEALRRQVIENVIPNSFIKKDKRRISENLKQIKEIITENFSQIEK
jgi:hypothetical protein